MCITAALLLFSHWSGNGLFAYCFHEVLDQIGSTSPTIHRLISGVPAIRHLFWALLAKLERRFLVLTQTICTGQYQAHRTDAAARGMIAVICLVYAAYDLAFTALIVSYAAKILPYHLYAKGYNTFNFVLLLALIADRIRQAQRVSELEKGETRYKSVRTPFQNNDPT
ncbi:hypothetical protein FIBSPDRAFT_550145 [Athelia psychrophila]|uniref:Uncharacterized protein n=1 Tax=Athelia psychrophila TaxID=1759441 RepID=A0A166USW6_9AGAM|nr:hypothetical protein FIBSPDRAFT_550145 [Fibularhizoctonia sp. CBS 109695]